MGRKRPHRTHLSPPTSAVPSRPTRRDEQRALLLAQVSRLTRACAQWDCELVRDLFEVGELAVGLEVLAEQVLECNTFQHPAFSVLLEVGRELGVGVTTLEALSALAARFASVSLVERCRAGNQNQTQRYYRDFLIDGVPLTERVHTDKIPAFDWYAPRVQSDILEQLSGRQPGALEGGRVPLCVCPECGDFGCGVISARVELSEDAVIWRDLGGQTDFEPGFYPIDAGPFRFERAQYFAVLGALRTSLGASHGRR